MRGRGALRALTRTPWAPVLSSAGGGLISLLAYGIVIWAMQSGRMGAVSALRETSVVSAVMIGRFALREAVSRKTWLACCIIAAGALCLGCNRTGAPSAGHIQPVRVRSGKRRFLNFFA